MSLKKYYHANSEIRVPSNRQSEENYIWHWKKVSLLGKDYGMNYQIQ